MDESSLRKSLLRNLKVILSVMIIALSLQGCSENGYGPAPPDPEEMRRDSITKLIISGLNKDSILRSVEWLEGFETRFALAGNRLLIARSIKDKLVRYGLTDTRIDSFEVTGIWQSGDFRSVQYNVISHLRGSAYPDSISVIGAHYDSHVSRSDPFISAPGANDNASGCAALLEIARVMAEKAYAPRGTIEFVFFAAEELGLHGSRHYAARALNQNQQIVMMINNDMIAWEPESKTASWYLNIINYDNSLNYLKIAGKLCSRYSTLLHYNDNQSFTSSDSYSFFINGFKAVFFNNRSSDPAYHTVSDRASRLNYDYCREVAGVSCAMLVYMN